LLRDVYAAVQLSEDVTVCPGSPFLVLFSSHDHSTMTVVFFLFSIVARLSPLPPCDHVNKWLPLKEGPSLTHSTFSF